MFSHLEQSQIQESYRYGYETAKIWDKNWIPGGPWIYVADIYDNEYKQHRAKFSQAYHQAWKEGWEKGRDERLQGCSERVLS